MQLLIMLSLATCGDGPPRQALAINSAATIHAASHPRRTGTLSAHPSMVAYTSLHQAKCRHPPFPLPWDPERQMTPSLPSNGRPTLCLKSLTRTTCSGEGKPECVVPLQLYEWLPLRTIDRLLVKRFISAIAWTGYEHRVADYAFIIEVPS
jgi:hypothetical protein